MSKAFAHSVVLFFVLSACLADQVSASLLQADQVVVLKSKRLLFLLSRGEILRAYRVALGRQPVGRKTSAGDKKTPEGIYILDSRKSDSKFHKAIHISYPNDSDVSYAERNGASPGSDIMIHGLPDNLQHIGPLHRYTDWTDGCIAVTNPEIEEIWKLVPDGIPIDIRP
ncbi:MAG: L,D-transpeptidase family protein [Nitrospirota bacterium]